MPINAQIPLSVQSPQFESPLNAFAKVLQVQGLQRQNELGGMQLEQTRRTAEEQNALRQLLGQEGFDINDPAAQRRLLAASPTGAPALMKARMDALKGGADLEKSRLEAATKRIDLMGQAFGYVRDNPTPENATAAVDSLVQNGVLSPQQAQQMKQQATSNPNGIRGMADSAFRAALSAKDQLPKSFNVDTGGTQVFGQTPALGGAPTITGALPKTVSPNTMATVGAQREQAQATRDAAKITGDRNTEMKLADDYRTQSKDFKAVSDAYSQINKTLGQARASPAATLAAATKFMKLLDPGSVVRESELGMALAASGVIDRAFNYYNVIQSGKVLTKQQTADFKNITNQIYQAAQEQQRLIDADYTAKAQTYGVRPEMVIQQLGQKGKPDAPAQSGGTAKVNSDADYEALPSGATFIGPDGKTRRKP